MPIVRGTPGMTDGQIAQLDAATADVTALEVTAPTAGQKAALGLVSESPPGTFKVTGDADVTGDFSQNTGSP